MNEQKIIWELGQDNQIKNLRTNKDEIINLEVNLAKN
jgi:hypothetical protein